MLLLGQLLLMSRLDYLTVSCPAFAAATGIACGDPDQFQNIRERFAVSTSPFKPLPIRFEVFLQKLPDEFVSNPQGFVLFCMNMPAFDPGI